ncbi:MAG: hypothetical protein HY044_00355 [Candidatus Woesebacteria bacterium]|nr:MAG: hypothetical protein HY044_00355 [Candidatus Woesebacteria bacterium]
MTSRITEPAPLKVAVTVTVVYGANRVTVEVPVGANAAAVAERARSQHDIVIDMSLVTAVLFDGHAGNVLSKPKVEESTKIVEFKTQARRNG